MPARWLITAWMVAIAPALGGCHLIPLSSNSEGLTPQRHGQLVVYSDFDLPTSHRLIREIVAERDDVCERLALPATDEPIHVHLHRDADQYADFRSRRYPEMPDRRAFFVETDTQLIVHAQWSDRVAEDLRHEVAHGYLHSTVGNLPLWLDEGLAEYFEVPPGRKGVNQPHVDFLADLLERECWKPDLARLEALDDFAALTQLDYAESWAWAHFLLETEPARKELLQAYLAELRTEVTAEPLARRLAKLHFQPEENLREHLLELRADSVARHEPPHRLTVDQL